MTHTPRTQTGHNSPRFENSTTNPETPILPKPTLKGQSILSRSKRKQKTGFPERTSYKQEYSWTLLTILTLLPTVTDYHLHTRQSGKKSPKASFRKRADWLRITTTINTATVKTMTSRDLAPHLQEKHALLIQFRCLPTKKAMKMKNRGTLYKILHDWDKQARIKWSL